MDHRGADRRAGGHRRVGGGRRGLGRGAGGGQGRRRGDPLGLPAVQDAQVVADIAGGRDLADDVRRLDRAGLRQVALLVAAADREGHQILRRGVRQIGAAQVGDGDLAEDVVDDRGRHLDGVVAGHHARRLKAGEGEGLHELFQRHAVLQADRHRDGEVVHQRAEGGALLVHVDEDLADAAVLILAGAQVDLVAADGRLLGVALAAVRQALALGALALDDALHDLLDDALGHHLSAGGVRRLDDLLDRVLLVVQQGGGERLAQLGAVAVQRVGLDAQAPGQQVGILALLDRRRVRHVDGLGDGAGDEGLRGGHHGDVRFPGQEALADAAAGVGAVEHRQMLVLQEGRAFQRHGAAAEGVRRLKLGLGEAESGQQVEARRVHLLGGDAQRVDDDVGADRPAVEGELDVEGGGEVALQLLQHLGREALGGQGLVVDARRALQRAVADRVALDRGDLVGGVAQRAQGLRHQTVDDLEVAAAGQLLELHQREVRLDARGVAIHDQTNGAGRGDHRGLGVAEAVLLAQFQRHVPGADGGHRQFLLRALVGDEGHRLDRQALVTLHLAAGSAAVVADDPQHVVAVLLIGREGAQLLRHLGGGGVGDAGHHRRDGGAVGAAFRRVVRQAGGHQQAAEVGEAQAQRAELVGQLGDLLGRELRHQHGDFQHHGPQAAGVLERLDVEGPVLQTERHQVQRGEVAGRVVEEHVLRARVRGVDAPRGRAGVPVVDRGVELHARIGTGPGGVADLVPQVAGADRAMDRAVGAADQLPLVVVQDGLDEVVGDAHRVVGILAGHRQVGVRVPIGVVGLELDAGEALAGELDHALDVVLRHLRLAGGDDGLLQLLVDLRVLAILSGGHDRGQVLLADLGAGNEGGDLLLLGHLPVDVGLDIRVVHVHRDHLGRTAGGAARLDGARRAVADLQEAHQARRLTAAGQLLTLAAQAGEVGAGARAVLEQARLADPQVHDAALVHQIVGDGLDEAGVRLRVLVGRGGRGQQAGLEIDVEVALARAVDAVGPVQAGVEPLRAVRGRHLGGQHEAHLVEEGAGVGLSVEIAALPAPVGPGAGQTVEDLLGRLLAGVALLLRQRRQSRFIGGLAPQPGRDGVLLDRLQGDRNAGLAEVLLGQDVAGDLAVILGNLDVRLLEDHRAVRVADLARRAAEAESGVSILTLFRETTLDPHVTRAPSGWRTKVSRSVRRSSRWLTNATPCMLVRILASSFGSSKTRPKILCA
ncbi:protein of unknown function [Azospirillum baldaniorum]|uniref:Uncharacterized protein n=1 Tax=Azospirillum baldaniorum TaxID=1064539 RepID=A0A9P1NLF0_9PROT|nr:protein of unknown function [Azospirillum baldaniorum]